MGHDITAIKDYTEYQKFWRSEFWRSDKCDFGKAGEFRKKSEVAYLRRSMNSDTIHELYIFLNCNNVYAGCSGDGSFVIVDIDEIKRAKEKVKDSGFDKEDKKDYTDFLNKCIHYCKSQDKEGVIIYFG